MARTRGLVGEGAVHAGDVVLDRVGPGGRRRGVDEVSRAALLFRRCVEADERGDTAGSEKLMAEIQATSSQATMKLLRASALLHVGGEQGWLPAADYDELMQELDALNADYPPLTDEARNAG
jgi:hypothetical protein